MIRVKKTAFILIGLTCIVVSSYLIGKDIFVNPYIPQNYTDCVENREEIPWMDWTNFCWYQYSSAEGINLSKDYQQVKRGDIPDIKGYFNNTKEWLMACDRIDEYSFDPACISQGDFWLLLTSEGEPRGNGTYEKYDDYKMYFFDKESARLYYLNNNA